MTKDNDDKSKPQQSETSDGMRNGQPNTCGWFAACLRHGIEVRFSDDAYFSPAYRRYVKQGN